MAIIRTISLSDLPHKEAPLWWHVQGLSYTASGYGSRIPTVHKVQLPDARGVLRWRRVYCCVWSNSGTCYVETGARKRTEYGKMRRDWIVITD